MRKHFLTQITALSILLLLSLETSVRADVCPNCGGTGKMISNFSVKTCSKCDGSGVVSSGAGIPTPNLPQTSYHSNKGDLMAEVRGSGPNGWVDAWSNDITETDMANGVVAAGVSIFGANPEVFAAWCNELVERTIRSLSNDIKSQFPGAVRSRCQELATGIFRAAVQGKDAREVFQRFDTIDFKAGAIRYCGGNYVNGTLIGPHTFGLKLYVCFRVHGSQKPPLPLPNGPQVTRHFIGRTAVYNSALFNQAVYDEVEYYDLGGNRWQVRNSSHRPDGVAIYTPSDTFATEVGRGQGWVALQSPGQVPIRLTDHGVQVYRDYPFRPIPPGINPVEVRWWPTTPGSFE